MKRRPLCRVFFFLPALLLIAGCAGGPYSSDIPLHDTAIRSPRLPFSYRVPVGWFDAQPGDSTANLVWLVKGDYGATMTVREIVLDAEARRRMADGGVKSIAQLSAGLAAADPSTVLLTAPEPVAVPHGEGFAFERANTATGDTVRVEIMGVEGRAFEVQALLPGGGKGATRETVFAAQRRFVEALRW